MLLGQTQGKLYFLKFPIIWDNNNNNSFAWHCSSCDHSLSRTDPGNATSKICILRKEWMCFSISFNTVAKRSLLIVEGFLDPYLDCNNFAL